MISAQELVSESLKKSVDLRLWLCLLLISFINIIVFFFVIVILAIPALAIYYLFTFNPVSLVLWIILGIIGLVIYLYIGAVVWAIILFIAKDFLEKGKISLNDSWNNALQRAPQLFIATSILFLFFALLFVLLSWPSIFPISDALSRAGASAIVDPGSFIIPMLQSAVLFTLMISVFFVIAVLVSPFTVLVAPTVVFEPIKAFSGIKKAIVAAKEAYWRNLAAIILYTIIVSVISFFFFVIIAGLGFLSIPFSSIPGFAIARMLIEVINFALEVFAGMIMLSFVSVFSINYYKANYFLPIDKEPKLKPEKNALEEQETKPDTETVTEKKTDSIKLEPWMGKKI